MTVCVCGYGVYVHLPEPAIISLTSSPSFSIMAGDTVTLTCSVTLPSAVTDTPVLQWEGPTGINSTSVISMTNGITVSRNLILDGISTSQAGEYTCTATLSGSITHSITITVQSKYILFCIQCIVHYMITIYHLTIFSSPNHHTIY